MPQLRTDDESVKFDAGSTARRSILTVAEPPASGDSIEIKVTTGQITLVVTTPQGQRISAANAEAAGFDWFVEVNPVPLGGDNDRTIQVVFRKPGALGKYVLEFTSPPLRAAARADVRFVSRLAAYTELIRSTPGAQIRSATLDGPADLPIDLPIDVDNGAALFDIVLKVPGEVRLTLPNARILMPGPGNREEWTWDTYEERYGNSDRPMFSEVLLPIEGIHHIVALAKAGKGRYVIRVDPGAKREDITVAFVPMSGIIETLHARERALRQPDPGQVKIEPELLPFECFVGDKLPVAVKLLGDIGSKPPQFEAHVQTRPLIRNETGVRSGDPKPVVTQPLSLTREADGAWHGSVVLSNPGIAWVSLRVSGDTASGKAFSEEALLTNSTIGVNPIVARVLSLGAKAVDENGDGRFDRLDITAELDVAYAGYYTLGFSIASARRPTNPQRANRVKLGRGRQTLTTSVPGQYVWSELRDGPYEITDVWILLSDPGFSIRLPPVKTAIRTEAWKREQWDPGKLFGQDTVTLHGIEPAPSGLFRFAEALWQVTTPGGQCSWYGDVYGIRTPADSRPQSPISANYTGALPEGRTTLSFIFNAAQIAGSDKRSWYFRAVIHCGSGEARTETSGQSLALDPTQYEPASASFSVRVLNPVRLSPDESTAITAYMLNVPGPVRLRVDHVPNGLEVVRTLSAFPAAKGEFDAAMQVRVSPDCETGRHAIEISAQSGTETATTELLVDVIGK